MKALVSPGRVQISSTLARGGSVNNRPGRPPCFVSLWRDCTNMDGYLLFSDGSLYHYDAPAMDVVVALTKALIHGQSFNFFYRRSLTVLGGYEKFTGIIPGTAMLIYHYPPYPGTDPGPCSTGLFDALTWPVPFTTYTAPVPVFGAAGNMASFTIDWEDPSNATAVFWDYDFNAAPINTQGHLVFTSATPYSCNAHVVVTNDNVMAGGYLLQVWQDGVNVLNESLGTPGTFDFPFTIIAGTGSLVEVVWDAYFSPASGGSPPAHSSALLTLTPG